MEAIAVIPARMASTRFPGKPLCRICGISMIEHVYRRTSMCRALKAVYVATCDREIAAEAEKFGAKAIMTSSRHKTCCDRVAEACLKIKVKADIIVNVQGDEPLIYPEMIAKAIEPFRDEPSLQCVNVISMIDNDRDYNNPSFIKVVKDLKDYALYYSREPIPSDKKCDSAYDRYRQVCILPFRKDFLFKFIKMPVTPLEAVESIDMLRIIENGYKIKLVESKIFSMAVDNQKDRQRVEKIMKDDPLLKKYCRKPNR